MGGCEQGRHSRGTVRGVREPEKQRGRGRAGTLLAGDRGPRDSVQPPARGHSVGSCGGRVGSQPWRAGQIALKKRGGVDVARVHTHF